MRCDGLRAHPPRMDDNRTRGWLLARLAAGDRHPHRDRDPAARSFRAHIRPVAAGSHTAIGSARSSPRRSRSPGWSGCSGSGAPAGATARRPGATASRANRPRSPSCATTRLPTTGRSRTPARAAGSWPGWSWCSPSSWSSSRRSSWSRRALRPRQLRRTVARGLPGLGCRVPIRRRGAGDRRAGLDGPDLARPDPGRAPGVALPRVGVRRPRAPSSPRMPPATRVPRTGSRSTRSSVRPCPLGPRRRPRT